MNTKQEIVDAMNGENVGQAPPALFSQSGTVELMAACGHGWPDANYCEDAMVALALQPSELLGFATVRIPFDLTSEAERLGCEIRRGDGGIQPSVVGSPWRTGPITGPPEFMPVDEFLAEGSCSLYVRTAERISREHPELFLTSCVNGPIEVAQFMLGAENFIMGLFMDPDTVNAWVRVMTPYQCEYARAMSEAADNVFVITEAAEEILPPDYFPQLAPYEREVYSSIRESFSTVHVCGETEHILDDLVSLGPTAVSVLSNGDPEGLYGRVGGRAVLAGGIDPIATLLQGTADDVRRSAARADEAGYGVVMPECGVPPQTRSANLEALANYR